MIVRGPVINDAQSILWSVCVEEQFYVICPLLLVLVPQRLRFGAVLGLMCSAVVLRWYSRESPSARLFDSIQYFRSDRHYAERRITCSGLSAFSPGARASRTAAWLQWPLYVALGWLFTRSNLAHGEAWRRTFDFVAIWAGALGLISVAVLHRGWLRAGLAYPRLVWLGKISYGLYMYHEMALWLRSLAAYWLGWFPNKEVLLTIGAFATTILLAAISYYGYERHFLKFKMRWTRVPSRPV